ncbi:MAG: tetratricopeptide repeat protein, partial [Gammaproteobacteria bacterium]|nr:tetratricopeptide repeat protein [Gammaproteobacteria bacterium]
FQNHLTLALFYQKTGEKLKAEEVLRSAITADEDDMKRKLVLIEFIKQTQGVKEAIAELEKIIKNNTGEGVLRLSLAQLQIENNDINGATATYKVAVKEFSEEETGITSRVQLAKIYMQEEDVQSAVSIIDEAVKIAPNDSQVNLVKAKIAMYNKNIEQAIISLRTVIKDNPDNIEAYFLLAAAHRENNEPGQVEDTIARAYENNRDNIKALLPLARYHMQNRDITEAEKVIDDYLRLDADNYDALSIKSAILNGKKNFAEAHELAEKMVDLYPDKENGYFQSVPALLSNKENDSAIQLLGDGYQKTGNIQILKLKAELQIASEKAGDAIAELETLEDADESVYLLLAKAHVVNKDNESSKKVLRDSIMQDKARTQSYVSLSSVYNSEGNSAEAIKVMQDGVDANPDDPRLRISLAGLYEAAGDIDSAIQQYEKLLESSPDNLIANNNLAALLSDHKSDEASLKRAREIADKLKVVNQPVIQDTVGWVYYKTGSPEDAVAVLKEVVAAQPDIPVFNYHLGMAYHKAGDKAAARTYLEAALATDKDFKGREMAESTLKSL